MTRKLQISSFFVLFLLLAAFSSMAMAPSAQELTATPTAKKLKATVTPSQPVREITVTPIRTRFAPAALAIQAGDSNWIAMIGILIVIIIVVPIMFKYNEWRRS